MRTQLTIACLAAVSQAINFDMSLAQTGACPPPCEPNGEDFNPDTDHDFHTEIDVTKDVIEDETEIVDEFVEETGVKDLLKAVVGCEEAGDVVDSIVKPLVEMEIADMLPIKQVVDVIKTMNDDEKVEVTDVLPSLMDVVETLTNDEQRAIDEPEIQFHATASAFTEEQMNTATVTEISGPNGEEMELIVVNKTGVVADDSPCPTDDLEEKAEEIADEIVDEIEEEVEEEAKPEPEPESESSESEEEEPAPPAKKKIEVYKTTVETMGEDPFALTNLVAAAKGKPVILDFQYDECGHCQEIAPEYEQMMFDNAGTSENPLAYFRKVDIFQHRERLADWGIKRFPTFKVFALGHEISHLEGKDAFHNDLKSAIDAAFSMYEGYQLGNSTEEVAVIDCSTIPNSLEGLDIKVEDIFDEIDANDDHMISEEEGRAAMACAFEKGWITEAEQSTIFNYFAGHAGEDNLDIEEMKAGFRGVQEVTDFDFGLDNDGDGTLNVE